MVRRSLQRGPSGNRDDCSLLYSADGDNRRARVLPGRTLDRFAGTTDIHRCHAGFDICFVSVVARRGTSMEPGSEFRSKYLGAVDT